MFFLNKSKNVSFIINLRIKKERNLIIFNLVKVGFHIFLDFHDKI